MFFKEFIALFRKPRLGKGRQVEDPTAQGTLISKRLREVMEITNPVPIKTPSAAGDADGRPERKRT